MSKTCQKCLKKDICYIRHTIQKTGSEIYKTTSFNFNKDDFKSSFDSYAETCEHYLIYKEGSVEDALSSMERAHRSISWCRAMSRKKNDDNSKRTIFEYKDNEKWMDEYVDCLERGMKQLEKQITILGGTCE